MPAGSKSVHRLDHGAALGLRTFLVASFAIGLMFADQRGDWLDAPRGWLMTAVYPIQVVAGTPAQFLNWSDDAGRTRAELARENNRLKRERLLADARLQQLNALRAENDRLRSMLDARQRLGSRLRVAQILEASADPFRHRVIIDKGEQDSVQPRQTVIDANGVVGQVLRVSPMTSAVLLISDPGHAIQVEVVRNGLRTVAFGSGDYESLNIRFLPNDADIQIGDILVTTSLDSDYPAGYPVAEIIAVEQQPRQAFAAVSARPAAELSRMREVLLLAPAESEVTATEPVDGE